MRLLRPNPLFLDVHRSGWPYAMAGLAPYVRKQGLLLDDFVEATFSYTAHPRPHLEPWVGIFHHPVQVQSPITGDRGFEISRILNKRAFRQSLPHLKGVIALTQELGDFLSKQLSRPVLVVKHPSGADAPQWQHHNDCLMQAGFFLRNPRLVHRIHTSFRRHRSKPYLEWHLRRDRQISKIGEISPMGVIELERLPANLYDEALSTMLLCMESFGSSANNVIVECIARSTPILVNRLPAIEEYLGKDYPLYFADYTEAAYITRDPTRISDAHQYLKDLDKSWLSNIRFGAQVNTFMEALCS